MTSTIGDLAGGLPRDVCRYCYQHGYKCFLTVAYRKDDASVVLDCMEFKRMDGAVFPAPGCRRLQQQDLTCIHGDL